MKRITIHRTAFTFFILFILAGCSRSPQEQLARSARSVNDQCPKMLDSETRIDGVEFRFPDTLRYNYSLVKLKAADLDTAEFRRITWPGIVSFIKVSSEMKKLRDNNTVIQYYYRDMDGKFISVFTVKPVDYN